MYLDYGELLSYIESFKQDCCQVRCGTIMGGGMLIVLLTES